MRGDKVFDRTRTDVALGERADLRRPLPSPETLVNWYFARLESACRPGFEALREAGLYSGPVGP